MYTLFFSVGKAVINRIVGHWKGGDITLKAIPTTKPIFFPSSFSWWLRGFPWKLPVAGSIPWNSQRYMESIESSSNAEPVSSANRSGGEGWYNVRKLHRKDLRAIFQQKMYLYFGFAWIFFFDIRLSRALTLWKPWSCTGRKAWRCKHCWTVWPTASAKILATHGLLGALPSCFCRRWRSWR